jgi:hypothetical protein
VVAVNRRLLAIYLNDHMAGSTGAVELSRRIAGSNQGSHYGAVMADLSAEIEEDRAMLASMMEQFGIRRDPVKSLVGWGAEKLGRFKLNGQLTGYSPLSRLEELEVLELAVTGKLLLCQALRQTESPPDEVEPLIERSHAQRERLEALRRDAAAEAFASETST